METLGTALTKTMPSVEDFEECARLMDEFDRSVERQLIFSIPSENGKLKIQPVSKMYESDMETEPMTKIETTVVEDNKLTEDQLMKQLRAGEYITKCGNFILEIDWGDTLYMHKKPSLHGGREQTMIVYPSLVKELEIITKLLESHNRAQGSKQEADYQLFRLNKLTKGDDSSEF